MTLAARRSRAISSRVPGLSLVLIGAGLACAGVSGLVAVQPELLLPADIRMWGTLAFATLAAGLVMLGAAVFVQRRGTAG